ncbi:MAG: response regulator transcription factor [Acidobacteria bacterium]|nr:response regulator transcription factor [Acidobacteriota bacterium]MBI3427745.1 response regulator transcription factor [Acidobacteriota bacterium]
MRILLVEDEPRMAHFIAKGLREQSFAVDLAADGEAALYQFSINDYDLLLLDVMLPRKDGYTVCRELRAQGMKTPILMLTARDTVDDRVEGLDAGADDYLVKPFAFRELLARVRALLRRAERVRTDVWPDVLQAADLTLNLNDHSALRAGRKISLTTKEYALLEYFMLHVGRLLTREEIAEHVWDENFDPFSNVIDVYVRRLRKKIDEGFTPALIHTRRGAGYLFTAEAAAEAGEDDVE